MRLYVCFTFALFAFQARGATLPEHIIPQVDEKLLEVVTEDLLKNVDNAQFLQNVENNPVSAGVENIQEVKRVEIDLNNPGLPQRQEHETQNSDIFDAAKLNEACFRKTITETQNIFNEGLLRISSDIQNLVTDGDQAVSVHESIRNLRETFTKHLKVLNDTIQHLWLPVVPATRSVSPVIENASFKQFQDDLEKLENKFETGVKSLSDGVDKITTLKKDTGGNPDDDDGGYVPHENVSNSGSTETHESSYNLGTNSGHTDEDHSSSDSGSINSSSSPNTSANNGCSVSNTANNLGSKPGSSSDGSYGSSSGGNYGSSSGGNYVSSSGGNYGSSSGGSSGSTSTGSSGGSGSTNPSTGFFQSFVQNIQNWQQQVQNIFTNLNNQVQNVINQNQHNNVSNGPSNSSSGYFENLGGGIQNIFNPQIGVQAPSSNNQQSSQASGSQSSGSQSPGSQSSGSGYIPSIPGYQSGNFFQNIQNSINGFLRPQQDTQQNKPEKPNGPFQSILQNIPFVSEFVTKKPSQVPSINGDNNKPQENTNSVPAQSTGESKPDNEKRKQEVITHAQQSVDIKPTGPIQTAILKNPIVQGIAGTMQRIQAVVRNPNEPRDTVEGSAKGHHGGYNGSNNSATGDNNNSDRLKSDSQSEEKIQENKESSSHEVKEAALPKTKEPLPIAAAVLENSDPQ